MNVPLVRKSEVIHAMVKTDFISKAIAPIIKGEILKMATLWVTLAPRFMNFRKHLRLKKAHWY